MPDTCPTCGSPVRVVGGETKHYVPADQPQPESYTRGEAAELLAHRECERAASWGHHEPWRDLHPETRRSYLRAACDDLAALSAALPDQRPEPLDERQERLEAELSDTEAAIERKRQEDGP